jgi:rhodanese-related sulfurtransferase
MQVALFLERQGFRDVVNLTGGIHAWSELVDPTVRTY